VRTKGALTPPMTPRPPALVTAAASLGPAATFMPASMTGCLIFRRSVIVVLICCGEAIVTVCLFEDEGDYAVRGEICGL